jgi:integrase
MTPAIGRTLPLGFAPLHLLRSIELVSEKLHKITHGKHSYRDLRIIPMAVGTGEDLKALRDRALLLIGFAGAFRRSELVALEVADIEETDTGLRVTIRRSKTDQEGAGTTIAIVRGSIACPVAALRAWLTAAGITTGALFRSIRKGGKVGERLSAQSVAEIVKIRAQRVGLDPAAFAGHSLRAGDPPALQSFSRNQHLPAPRPRS